MNRIRFIIILGLVFSLVVPQYNTPAQDETPAGPIYIVQSGDNLTLIASRFGISANDLINANQIENANNLKIGDELVIPGLQGVEGYLVTQTVGFGDTLQQLSSQNNVALDLLVKLNHLTSPAELYAGVNLVIPQPADAEQEPQRGMASNGMSMLEYAILAGASPWTIKSQNDLQGDWDLLPGETYSLPPAGDHPSVLPVSPFDQIEISPLPMVQGKTTVIKMKSQPDTVYGGSLTGHDLAFFSDGEGTDISLQGIYAMQEPGIYPLLITATTADGTKVQAEKMVVIQDGYYSQDPVLVVEYSFIDPAVTEPELEWLTGVTSQYTPEKLWDGKWISPSPYSYQECLNSKYGNRRSYNGGPYDNFHTGVDFCGGDGVQILAPAAGRVVFAGEKTVRGNATIIDHGWGIYTGYWHQSAIYVKEGDMVQPGDIIGLVGGTGRVTGAHLHFEVWAGGVQVQPIDWLEKVYP